MRCFLSSLTNSSWNEADRLRDRKVCLELHQQVDMVRHAADLQQDTPLTAE